MQQYCINLFDRYRVENALKNKNIAYKLERGNFITVSDCDAEDVEAILYETDVAYDLMKG